ncbi:hypothetical protein F4802DRAFT_542242 [Xylaria palmicola]|nr:hypothetical protein F4802DRAFT_542242 [Xylaria palmicola]
MAKYTDDQAIDEPLVKSLSQLLTDCGANPVLWGDYLLTIYGVPSIVGGLEFIVSDEKLPAAVAALKRTRLSPCQDPSVCPISGDADLRHIPAFHMHIGTSRPVVYVSLWRHSEILGFSPDVNVRKEGLVLEGHALGSYVLASDTTCLPGPRAGRGHGALSTGGGQVIVPSAHTMLEAYIRLSAAYRHSHGAFYMSMIIYVEEYIDADGFLDDTLLSEPGRTFWQGWKKAELSIWELCRQFEANLHVRGVSTMEAH